MSKVEQFICLLFGFFIFEILFIRIGFFLTIPILPQTLPVSLFIYMCCVFAIYIIFSNSRTNFFSKLIPFAGFIITISFLFTSSLYLANTFDTSWDGQGYHQSAVIAYANKWNPVYQSTIKFSQRLPSQIFSEGYPSALWEIEGAVYAFIGRVNAAKVVNIAISLLALIITYDLFRKLLFGKFLSSVISLCIVLQPVFMIQLLTFMEDGFGYELLLVAAASLIIWLISKKSYWAMILFTFSLFFLATTKYSQLPVVLFLSIIAILVIVNRILNREYVFHLKTNSILVFIFISGIIFAYLPYGRNLLFHKAMFYPTNIPSLMGSVTYNNVPNNLQKGNRIVLLFYGIFSKAQSHASGDPRSKANIAQLKLPFLFTFDELIGSADLYNNRVGAAGPLFSGTVILAILLITLSYFSAKNKKQRYAVYVSAFCFLIILALSLVAPTPNLMRYVSQLQLLPFVVIIPIYIAFQKSKMHFLLIATLLLACVNVLFFSYAVFYKTTREMDVLTVQLQTMKISKKVYAVRSQQFYSTYILLKEQNIPYKEVSVLPCTHMQTLASSSTTTQYCPQ